MTTLPGIVLAAGASSRMGRPKTLLSIGGSTFVGRVLGALADAGADPLVLVTREPTDVASAWHDPRAAGVRVVVNDAPDRGQLSSLLCAVDALSPEPVAVVMTLVDVPLVRPETVRQLIDRYHASGAPLVRPTFEGRHGHPVIFAGALLTELRTAEVTAGAKPIVHRFASLGVDVAVADPGILVDVDTPDDYARLLAP
jgi:molybdenum cofactor cytidylyltransferase